MSCHTSRDLEDTDQWSSSLAFQRDRAEAGSALLGEALLALEGIQLGTGSPQ